MAQEEVLNLINANKSALEECKKLLPIIENSAENGFTAEEQEQLDKAWLHYYETFWSVEAELPVSEILSFLSIKSNGEVKSILHDLVYNDQYLLHLIMKYAIAYGLHPADLERELVFNKGKISEEYIKETAISIVLEKESS